MTNKSIISYFERYHVLILVLYLFIVGLINGLYFYSPSPDEWKTLHSTIVMAEELKNGDWIGNSMVGAHGFIFKLIPAFVFILMEPTIYIPYFYHLIINIFLVFLTYKVGLHLLKSKNWAFVATIVLISSPLFISGNLNYLREMPSHFALVLILYLLLYRKSVIWVGLALMLAIDAKEYIGIMAFAAVFIHTFFDLIKEYGLFSIKFLQNSIGKFFVYVVPTILYIYLMFWTSLVPENPSLTSLLKLNIGAADSKIYFSLGTFLYSSKNKNSDIIAKNEYLINRKQWLKSEGMRDSLTKLIKYRNNIENNIDYSKLKNMPLFQDNENLTFSLIDSLFDDILLAYKIYEETNVNKEIIKRDSKGGIEVTSLKVEALSNLNDYDYGDLNKIQSANRMISSNNNSNLFNSKVPDRRIIISHFINEFKKLGGENNSIKRKKLRNQLEKLANQSKINSNDKLVTLNKLDAVSKSDLYRDIIYELELYKIVKPKEKIIEPEPKLATTSNSKTPDLFSKSISSLIIKKDSIAGSTKIPLMALNTSGQSPKLALVSPKFSINRVNQSSNLSKVNIAKELYSTKRGFRNTSSTSETAIAMTSPTSVSLGMRESSNLDNKKPPQGLKEKVPVLIGTGREAIALDRSVQNVLTRRTVITEGGTLRKSDEISTKGISSLFAEKERKLVSSHREGILSDSRIQTDLPLKRTNLKTNIEERNRKDSTVNHTPVLASLSPTIDLSSNKHGIRIAGITGESAISRTSPTTLSSGMRESSTLENKTLPQSILEKVPELTGTGRDAIASERGVKSEIKPNDGSIKSLSVRSKVGDVSESITRNIVPLQIQGKFNPAYTDNDIKKEYNKLDSNAKDKIKKQFDKLGTEEKKQIAGLVNKNIVLAKLTSGELNFKSIQRDKIENINPNIKIKIPIEPTNLNNPVTKRNESSDKKGKLIDGFKSVNPDSTSKEKDIIDLEKESLVYNPVLGEKENDFDRFKLYESSYEKYKAYFELFTDRIFAHYTFNYVSYPIFIVLLSLMTIVLLLYKWRENTDWIFIIIFLFMALAVYIFRTHQPRYLHPAIISIPFLIIYASQNYLKNKIFLSFFLSLSISLNIYQIYINDFTYTLLPSLFLLFILVPVFFVNNTLKRYFIYLFLTLYLFLNIAYVLNGKMENIANNPVNNLESEARQYAKCFDLNNPGVVYFISDYPKTNIIHSTINFYNRDINSSSEEGMNILTYVNPDLPKFRLNKYYIPHLFSIFKFSINYSMTNWNQIKGFLPYNKISKVTFLIPNDINWDDYEVKYVKSGEFNLYDNSKSGILQDWKNIMLKYQMLLFKTRTDWLELESKHRIGNDKTLYIFRVNDKYLDENN